VGKAVLAAAAVLVLTATGCGSTPTPRDELRIMVPNPAGSGYDLTARTMASALEETGLSDDVEVFNLAGDNGMAALGRLMHEHGDDRLVMQMGLGLVGSTHVHAPEHTVQDATPLARMLGEPQAVLVPAESPYRELSDLIEDWRAEPGALTVAGGSQLGGPDHLTAMLLAREVGVDPREVDYVVHDGGGELVEEVLSGEVDMATAGTGQHRHFIDAGQLRVLAVTGARPSDGIDAPTLRETGIDLTFLNWRGVVAPRGIGEAERHALEALLAGLRESPHWRGSLEAQGWDDAFLAGEDFAEFLDDEHRRVAQLVEELGL
jgi:putative tricarboxylic transport membrane protein